MTCKVLTRIYGFIAALVAITFLIGPAVAQIDVIPEEPRRESPIPTEVPTEAKNKLSTEFVVHFLEPFLQTNKAWGADKPDIGELIDEYLMKRRWSEGTNSMHGKSFFISTGQGSLWMHNLKDKKDKNERFYSLLIATRIAHLLSAEGVVNESYRTIGKEITTESINGNGVIKKVEVISASSNGVISGLMSIKSFFFTSQEVTLVGSIYLVSERTHNFAKYILNGSHVLPPKTKGKARKAIADQIPKSPETLFANLEKTILMINENGERCAVSFGIALASEPNANWRAIWRASRSFLGMLKVEMYSRSKSTEISTNDQTQYSRPMNFEKEIRTLRSYLFSENTEKSFLEEYRDAEFDYKTFETAKTEGARITMRKVDYEAENSKTFQKFFPNLSVLRIWRGKDPMFKEPIVGAIVVWEKK